MEEVFVVVRVFMMVLKGILSCMMSRLGFGLGRVVKCFGFNE